MDQTLHLALPLLIALMPAALALWWGRGISRHLDDPLLPERLFANRKRTGPAFGVAIALLAVTATDQLAWALPLLVLARMAAAYPLRKALYNETWTFGAYLSFFARLLVAVFGLWILLSTIPLLAGLAGPRDWIVAGALAAIVVAWHARYSTVFRRVLRTRAVDDPEIVSRFSQMLKVCGLPPVSLEQVDLRGGVFANGVALPSIRRPAVVITETLITRLDRDETTAILAHELAHLEFYNPRRLRWNSALTYILVAVGALLYPVLRLTAPEALSTAPLIWPFVLVAVGLFRVQHRQKHETESDLRALELTGDADALIRALSKLHAFARLPRRWDSEFERHATHPSLARRIQAIRAAAGTAPASVGESATFAGPTGSTSVTFHDERLEWSESALTRGIDYGRLAELRIHTRASGSPRLVAVDATNRRWEIALQSSDVARVQAILDIVDMRLGKAGTPPVIPGRTARVLTLLTIFAGIAMGQFSVLIAGCLALIRPASQLAAAAGVSAVAAVVLTGQGRAFWPGESPSWLPVALFCAGAALVGVAFANRTETAPAVARKLVWLLALCSALAWVVMLMRGIEALDLYQSAIEWPGISIVTLGLAGALAFSRSSRARWAAVAAAIAGVFAGFLGSATFADQFLSDPFVSSAPPMAVTTVTGPPLEEFSLSFDAAAFWISGTGRYVALRTEDGDDHSTIRAGRLGGPLADFDADEAVFLNESRLLLLKREGRTSALRVVDLGAGNREIWSDKFPVFWARVSLDRPSERWRLLGWDAAGDFVSTEGHVGDDAVSQMHWGSAANGAEGLQPIAVSHGAVLAMTTHPVPAFLSSFNPPLWLSVFGVAPRTESQLWALDSHGRQELATSRIELRCLGSVLIDESALCVAFAARTTRFFAVNPATRRLTALSAVSGWVLLNGMADHNWIAGWWNGGPAAFSPTLREAIRVVPADGERPGQLAVGETVLASLSPRGDRSTIRVYAIPAGRSSGR